MKRTAAQDILDLENSVIEAGRVAQTASLDLLRAEMHALANMMPGHDDVARSDAEIEGDFDNMPV